MSVRVSCPYCNTAITVADVPTNRRVACPRCGESFPIKASTESETQPASSIPVESANGELTHPIPRLPAEPPNVARPLLPLLLMGLVLGAIVLGVGLTAILSRPVPTAPATTAPKPPSTWPPMAVPGLAYLPDDVNVVASVQPRALAAFAERVMATPKQLFAEAGVPEQVLGTFEKLGLAPEKIDHITAGLSVGDADLIPRGVLVLALSAPLADETPFLKGLDAKTIADAPGRYTVNLGGLPVTMTKLGDAVYVFAKEGKDLENLSGKKSRGTSFLSAGVRETMAKLNPASVAWVVGGPEKWTAKAIVRDGSKMLNQPDIVKQLDGVRAAALGVWPDMELKWTAAVRAESEGATKGVKERLVQRLGEKATFQGEGDWITGEGNVKK